MTLAQWIELIHLEALSLFAFFTSLVFAFLSKRTRKERAKYFFWLFFLFLVVALGMGWLMYPFPR